MKSTIAKELYNKPVRCLIKGARMNLFYFFGLLKQRLHPIIYMILTMNKLVRRVGCSFEVEVVGQKSPGWK